jgi:hypothetical protein
MQLDLTVLTKTKESNLLLRIARITVAEALSTYISIILTRVSVPVEDGSHQSSFFTHVHKGPVPNYSLMSTKDQYRSTHLCPIR